MKYLLIGVFVLLGSLYSVEAQKIHWLTLNEALAAQEKTPKKIFMDVYTNWCPPCKLMDKKTFQNDDVIDYINENYYAVKFNAEGTEEVRYNNTTFTNPEYRKGKFGRNSMHMFTQALKINSYPSIVFFDEKGAMIAPVPGYRTPQQLELYLKMIQNDDYKGLTSTEAWESYEKAFVPTFKG